MASVNITTKNTTTVELPTYEGAKVVIDNVLTVGDIEAIRASVTVEPSEEDKFNEAVGNAMVLKSIVSWNLSDDKGDLDITIENLKRLPFKDYQVVLQAVTGEQKTDSEGNLLSAAEVDAARKKK